MARVLIITRLLCNLFGVNFDDHAACWQDVSRDRSQAFVCVVDTENAHIDVSQSVLGSLEITATVK